MDGCFRDGADRSRSTNVGHSVLLEEFERGDNFLGWVCTLIGAARMELRARTAGATLSELADPGEHPSCLKRRCRCTSLGLPSMGLLLGQVARAVDRSAEAPSCPPDAAAWVIARRLAPSHRFLDECADICMLAYALAPTERDVLRARLEGGSVAAAAKLIRRSPSMVANVSTQIFAKLGIHFFAQMPRAIADAIDQLNAAGPSRDRDGRA